MLAVQTRGWLCPSRPLGPRSPRRRPRITTSRKSVPSHLAIVQMAATTETASQYALRAAAPRQTKVLPRTCATALQHWHRRDQSRQRGLSLAISMRGQLSRALPLAPFLVLNPHLRPLHRAVPSPVRPLPKTTLHAILPLALGMARRALQAPFRSSVTTFRSARVRAIATLAALRGASPADATRTVADLCAPGRLDKSSGDLPMSLSVRFRPSRSSPSHPTATRRRTTGWI